MEIVSMEKPRGTGPRLLRFRREPVTAQGNTVTDEKVIAVLSLSSSACVGFGRRYPTHIKAGGILARRAVPRLLHYHLGRSDAANAKDASDRLRWLAPAMVSAFPDLSPGATPCRGFFMAGFGRRS
jgi:hypothetical protein